MDESNYTLGCLNFLFSAVLAKDEQHLLGQFLWNTYIPQIFHS